MPGADAYATSKQCNLATVLELARQTSRLGFNAVEPGFNPGTDLGREANVFVRFLLRYVVTLFAPMFMKYASAPERTARVITDVLLNKSAQTGIYYDERGNPMLGSVLVHEPDFSVMPVRRWASTRRRRLDKNAKRIIRGVTWYHNFNGRSENRNDFIMLHGIPR